MIPTPKRFTELLCKNLKREYLASTKLRTGMEDAYGKVKCGITFIKPKCGCICKPASSLLTGFYTALQFNEYLLDSLFISRAKAVVPPSLPLVSLTNSASSLLVKPAELIFNTLTVFLPQRIKNKLTKTLHNYKVLRQIEQKEVVKPFIALFEYTQPVSSSEEVVAEFKKFRDEAVKGYPNGARVSLKEARNVYAKRVAVKQLQKTVDVELELTLRGEWGNLNSLDKHFAAQISFVKKDETWIPSSFSYSPL